VLIGRAGERAAIEAALTALRGGAGGVLLLEGEPGIGKSRLLAHLAGSAAGCTVLSARASEYESDLPLALFTDALDRHLEEMGDRAVARLGLADPAALAAALPVLGAAEGPASDGPSPVVPGAPPAADRHRLHRALRDLLERLAAVRPLVVCLDDLHWADPASVDALAALVHRPPAAPVLLALAARENRVPAALAAVPALRLVPLTQAEAAELVGPGAPALYAQAGGNPFYLEQLARLRGAVPPTVAAAVAAELTGLRPPARAMLDAAAVAGDPFEVGLAAAVAELPEPQALAALDELLHGALVREAGAPRRFAFRHPVVRHAVYDAIPGGRRLGAHARAAAELQRRGAGVVERAHHVEHAAEPGDPAAIELLTGAAERLQALAPAGAARFYAAARRLQAAPDARLSARLADAQAAAGDPVAARATLLDAMSVAGAADRLLLTVALANQEWWLGDHEDARRRVHVVLGDLPAEPSADRVRLRLSLCLTALLACDLGDAIDQAADARTDARALGDPVFEFAAVAATTMVAASREDRRWAGAARPPGAAGALGPHGAAEAALRESTALMERLAPQELAVRLPGLWMRGRALRILGRPAEALAEIDRGIALAAETGRERVLVVCTVERAAVLTELGRLADAAAAAEEGVERARLAGNPRMLLWAHAALSTARLGAGDVPAALEQAEAAGALGVAADFHAAGQPGWCLGAALTAGGQAARGAAAIEAALPAVLPCDRGAAVADLIEAQLAAGNAEAAAGGLARAAPAGRAAVLIAMGRAEEAVAVTAAQAAPPLAAARLRLLHGRALAAAGRRAEAIEALAAAEAALDGFGAIRLRDEAVRELRRLGHRVVRSSRADGDDPLTSREREIAELVAGGRTNREVAEQLVLSTRTVDAHLRTIYAKLGVRSRVELTRRLS
jgi:DNA-binding NarL/FixJ family response regulator/tetratricopeptide (TPR) repeat protein